MPGNAQRLDQLTSLRFFAASMIVIHHSAGLFGIGSESGASLSQGVSFFYVLSGFILTYVYPKLETRQSALLFLRARVARIFPAYLITFVLGFWLVPYRWETPTAWANVAMVQAWVPLSKFYFSYNGVAWSVSTEFFFYLLFPWLIQNIQSTWRVKLAGSLAVLLALVIAAVVLKLPAYGIPGDAVQGYWVTQHGLIFISPLARMFEFVLGVSLAVAWGAKGAGGFVARFGTLAEIAVVCLCALNVACTAPISEWMGSSIAGRPAALWIAHSGSAFAFGGLIYVMALGSGRISQFLARPPLVLLGEISFSLYLLHLMILNYYRVHFAGRIHVPDAVSFAMVATFLVCASYVMWVAIEMPGRRLILGHGTIHGDSVIRRLWSGGSLLLNAKFAVAIVSLLAIFGANRVLLDRLDYVSNAEAADMTPSNLTRYTGAAFGDQLVLRGLELSRSKDGLHVKLAWESIAKKPLSYTYAVHLVDDGGKILAQADHRQHSAGIPQDIWLDSFVIPSAKLTGDTRSMAIGIYDDSGRLYPIDKGERDWDGHRLVIPIPE